MKKSLKMVLGGFEVERLTENPKYNWLVSAKGLSNKYKSFREVCSFIFGTEKVDHEAISKYRKGSKE